MRRLSSSIEFLFGFSTELLHDNYGSHSRSYFVPDRTDGGSREENESDDRYGGQRRKLLRSPMSLNNLVKPMVDERRNPTWSSSRRSMPGRTMLALSPPCSTTISELRLPCRSWFVPTVFATTKSVMETVRIAQVEIAKSIFERARKICKESRVRSETLIVEGSPKEMICQAAEQMHVDMLVLGSRGLGQIKRAFLESVYDYCAHQLSCPVLIVKPPRTHTGSCVPSSS